MKAKKLLGLGCLLSFTLFFIACGGGGGSDTSQTGTLSLGLTDAASIEYKAVYVTISEIKVHNSGAADSDDEGWVTVATPNRTFNLLELMNGVIEPLGIKDLPIGTYSQMRLYLGAQQDAGQNILGDDHAFPHYLILNDNTIKQLDVPSGYQSGVKLVHPFDIRVAGLTELIVDFDASASVVRAGKSGKHLLKPTIKITDMVDNAILSGTVADDSTEPAYLDLALVSAQYYDTYPTDPIVYTATGTVGGDYMMYLPPNTYNIVAYKYGYAPACVQITTGFGDILTEDFVLDKIEPDKVTINIDYLPALETGGDAPTAIISFYKIQDCGISTEDYHSPANRCYVEGPAVAEDQIIELEKEDVTGLTSAEISLPAGAYTFVASCEGRETVTGGFNTAETTTLSIEFLGAVE